MADLLERLAELHRRGVELPARLTREDQRRILAGEWPGQGGQSGQRKRRHKPEQPYPWAIPGRTVTIVLDGWRPLSANKWGRNQWTRKQAVAAVRAELLATRPELLLPVERRPPELKTYWRPRVEFVIYQDRERYPDPGNFHKPIVDALKRVQLIREDNHRVIELVPERFPVDPDNPRTEITITERGPE